VTEHGPELEAEGAGTPPAPASGWLEGRAAPDWAEEAARRSGHARIGPYLLGPVLGEGGMGTVHLAWDAILGRRVALKLVRGESADLLRRMIQEARLQARVEHPAVCRIYQVGEEPDRPYIAMQYIQGANLAEWAPHLGLEGKLRLLIQVADAVNTAHRMGLIHRDLKPSNLLVEQDEAGVLRPFVMDFGLARDMGGIGITQHGIAVGSPSYMAPEQAIGERVDERTDVYGLGATLYEILSGRPPFRGGTVVETVRLVMESEAPMLRSLVPAVPPDLESVVHKCLDKDPARRYGSARELRDDLQRCLDGEPVEARRQNRLRRTWLRMKRNKPLSLVVAAATVLVLGIGGFAAWTWRQAREQAFWAQRFGSQVREMDATLRNAHLFPLHDLRPERADVQARIDRIQEQMKQLGRASQGPGFFALGQGYLMLDRPDAARAALQSAWSGGYRTPDVALALAEALADLHRREVEGAFMIARESLRRAALEQIQRTYQDPIRQYLGFARQGGGLTPVQAAVIARIEHRPAEAARLAREGFDRQRWNYEARLEEVEALFQAARESADRDEEHLAGPRLDEAERLLAWLKEAVRSDPRVHLCDAQARLLRIRLGLPGRPLEQSLREGLAALDRALKADPSSGEPHLLRAAMFRWMAADRSIQPAQVAYWMDRAIEATVHAAADPHTRGRARAAQGSLLLAKAQRLLEAGRDPSQAVAEGCALWAGSVGEGLELASAGLQGALEKAFGQLLLADHAQGAGRDPLPFLLSARSSLERLVQVDPSEMDGRLELARVLRRIGEAQAHRGQDPSPVLAEAKAHIDAYLQVFPSNGSAWNHLGTLARVQAEAAVRSGSDPGPYLDVAAAAFGNAWRIRPRAALYPLNLQEVRVLQGIRALRRGEDPAEPIREADLLLSRARRLEGAEDLAPEFPAASAHARLVLAEAALLRGAPAEAPLQAARQDAGEAARLGPRQSRTWKLLAGVSLLAAGSGRMTALAEARRALARAARIDASDPEIPLLDGRVDLLEAVRGRARGGPAEALLDRADGKALRALALDPRNAGAHALRACVSLARTALPDREAQVWTAADQARAALALNPRHLQALAVLARAELLLGRAGTTAPGDRGYDPALEDLLPGPVKASGPQDPPPAGLPRRPR